MSSFAHTVLFGIFPGAHCRGKLVTAGQESAPPWRTGGDGWFCSGTGKYGMVQNKIIHMPAQSLFQNYLHFYRSYISQIYIFTPHCSWVSAGMSIQKLVQVGVLHQTALLLN